MPPSRLSRLLACCVLVSIFFAATWAALPPVAPYWASFSARQLVVNGLGESNETVSDGQYFIDAVNLRTALYGSLDNIGDWGNYSMEGTINFYQAGQAQSVAIYPFFQREVCYAYPVGAFWIYPNEFITENATWRGTTELEDKSYDLWEWDFTAGYFKWYVDKHAHLYLVEYFLWDSAQKKNGTYLYTFYTNWVDGLPDARQFQAPADCLNVTAMAMSGTTGEDDLLLVNDPETIRSVNAHAKTWRAGPNDRFDGITRGQARRLLGWKFQGPSVGARQPRRAPNGASHAACASNQDVSIPSSFDARTAWPECTTIGQIRNQESCGGCWAFAAAETASDRFCIASDGAVNVALSEQWLMECSTADNGCGGGMIDLVWDFLTAEGTTTESCVPFANGSAAMSTPACPKFCVASQQSPQLYRFREAYTPGTAAADIQAEILSFGPVQAAMMVFHDFLTYKSGIYQITPGSLFQGGHSIKIIGWGTEQGVDYWLCANSWGPAWGVNGTFQILRGANEAGIENMVAAGIPDV